jgi:hypothetical protein
MEQLRRVLRDPLVHFLAAGGFLFALYAWFGPEDYPTDEQRTIVVDKPTLVTYMEYRQQAFQPDYYNKAFDAMSPADRQQLIDSYVREEAMTREARAMGLDSADYVIRQRLVQKMNFLMDGASQDRPPPSDAELQAYYRQNPENYLRAESLTFTHVFVDNEVAHPGDREMLAEHLKSELNARHAQFNDAPQYGDRFPYLENYVGRTPEFIANQFGQGFLDALEKLKPSDNWQGPIKSDYGWHVVLFTKHEPASLPSFDEVKQQVADDYANAIKSRFRKQATDDLLRQYKVRLVDLPAADKPADIGG